MSKKKPDAARKKPGPAPKPKPDLVLIKLQLTPAERDLLRQVAFASPHGNMAVWCRELVREALAGYKVTVTREKTSHNPRQPG